MGVEKEEKKEKEKEKIPHMCESIVHRPKCRVRTDSGNEAYKILAGPMMDCP